MSHQLITGPIFWYSFISCPGNFACKIGYIHYSLSSGDASVCPPADRDIIGSDNDLSPVRRQPNADFLLRPFETKFHEMSQENAFETDIHGYVSSGDNVPLSRYTYHGLATFVLCSIAVSYR